jgi:hypothetical protein
METTKSYRILIEEIVREEYDETVEKYVKDGIIIEWGEWYKLPEDEKNDWTKTDIPTGKKNTDERTIKLYEQEKTELDVGELAIFINRAS